MNIGKYIPENTSQLMQLNLHNLAEIEMTNKNPKSTLVFHLKA